MAHDQLEILVEEFPDKGRIMVRKVTGTTKPPWRSLVSCSAGSSAEASMVQAQEEVLWR